MPGATGTDSSGMLLPTMYSTGNPFAADLSLVWPLVTFVGESDCTVAA